MGSKNRILRDNEATDALAAITSGEKFECTRGLGDAIYRARMVGARVIVEYTSSEGVVRMDERHPGLSAFAAYYGLSMKKASVMSETEARKIYSVFQHITEARALLSELTDPVSVAMNATLCNKLEERYRHRLFDALEALGLDGDTGEPKENPQADTENQK